MIFVDLGYENSHPACMTVRQHQFVFYKSVLDWGTFDV